jgi:tetratricopeptide (TPR) repeat protein
VFSWSYRHLTADAARQFRLLGLHPGPDFDSYAAAALSGITREQAQRQLDQLARAHLIQQTRTGRYTMHDLLRDYAAGQASQHDTKPDQQASLTRLFDYYLHAAATAVAAAKPGGHYWPSMPLQASPVPEMSSSLVARAWLDTERPALLAVAALAAAQGHADYTTDLAAILTAYLYKGGHFPGALTIHTHVLDIASQTGDRAAEAKALIHIGVVECWQGSYQQAADHLGHALTLSGQVGDQALQASALGNLGVLHMLLGRYASAARHEDEGLALYRQRGDLIGQAWMLGNLGIAYERQGRYQPAVSHLRQALAMSRETGDQTRQAYALSNLGVVHTRLGNYQQAVGHEHQALSIFRDISDKCGETETLNNFGDAFLAVGEPKQARTYYTGALRLASQIGFERQIARAHDGLARTYTATSQARHHWQEALTRYSNLTAPETPAIRANLTELANQAVTLADTAERTP